MSEKTVLIATEGRSDFVFFETLIAKLAKEKNQKCTVIMLHPEYDATLGRCHGRGWTGLKKCLQDFNPTPVQLALTEKDQKIWDQIVSCTGAHVPMQESVVSWEIIKGTYNQPCFLFHMDSDVIYEICKKENDCNEIVTPILYCEKKLKEWSGISTDAIYAVSVQCLETWFLAAFLADIKTKCINLECLTSEDVYYFLMNDFLCQKYIDINKNIETVDKIKLTTSSTNIVVEHWNDVCQVCESANLLNNRLEEFFHRE